MKLLRNVVDGFTQLLGSVKRNRRIRPKGDSPLLVNLGCGLSVCAGWLNIDGSLNALIASWPGFMHRLFYRLSGASQYYSQQEYCDLLQKHRFIHHDLIHGIPLVDGVVDVVYTSHFLEHLYKNDGKRLLQEAYRVLKPNGTLRVCVPDLEYAIALYSRGEKEKMLLNNFFVEDQGSQYARHKYMYDFEMLKTILDEIGFKEVRRRAYRQGQTPNLDCLDNRPEETLYIEARR